MLRVLSTVCLTLMLMGCGGGAYRLAVHYDSSAVPDPPDYSQRKTWAALPDARDAADSVPLNSSLADHQADANADVFFVYPTIFTSRPKNQFQWNADVADGTLNEQIQKTTILNQATIFNGSCRVYAPYYRQAHLYAFYTDDKQDAEKALDLAYQDIRRAFQYYLDHYNKGRPIVVASHSQGSYHAMRLLKEFFDGKELQKQLVVGYLVGRAIPADYFQSIKPTDRPDETGVWASWNTFKHGFIPHNYDRFYTKALSTNPLLWNSSEEFASKDLNPGGVGPKFTMIPHLSDAQNHQNLLWINKPYVTARALIRTKVWHRADMNLFYLNIRENVSLRIEAFLRETAR